ncbi:uncharacterized protein L3040_005509 [Drepanopeziza brunnea f. sp. 'multigermtubi']|uniref:Mmc protein n=1 Tax=Marssonina brunnea f. sp. multigermtubi (strain MB_m1) TaxID=1072389 RepID=K1W9E6_MARBU|nr:mmc protein [Drepanopeziza brunnea f. sp. 'multigermtubi' MB_m1]EKD13875.1 mmc protein [Drepanopeziza brunnea f. sp. 'multigermtubi' MB_m1]KAJ5040950.1 hypothetical protein L3040_005509 [Drepanopeziza brunnea f. sp. 'multigermtubi']
MLSSAVTFLALASSAAANYGYGYGYGSGSGSNASVVYITEVHTAYTTYCPASTELTFNGVTYTATESTTLVITNCPCTVIKPVVTSSYVECTTCSAPSPSIPASPPVVPSVPAAPPVVPSVPAAPPVVPSAPSPVYPTATPVVPVYPTSNSTAVVPTTPPAGTGALSIPSIPPTPVASTTAPLVASGANKAMAVSGGSLAGLLCLAAYLL